MKIVTSLAALQDWLERADAEAWGAEPNVPENGAWGVLPVRVEDVLCVFHRSDVASTPRIVIIPPDTSMVRPETWRTIFQRVHTAARHADSVPFRLPPSWKEYHLGNLVAFFAIQEEQGTLRWIIQVHADNTDDTCFLRLTNSDDQVPLEDFIPDISGYRAAVSAWRLGLQTASARFAETTAIPRSTVDAAVDLEAASFGAVVRGRRYSEWTKLLTPQQRTFFESPATHSIKLRGPAGTGKTLVLILKALREIYASRAAGMETRVLFATHSWAVAEQVDEMVRALDESGGVPEIEIFPLLQIAKQHLPPERSVQDAAMLGDDSLSGKKEQLVRIDEIVERMSKGEWIRFTSAASSQLKQRMASAAGSAERNALVWDLMNEFSSVLSAHGILPGVNAERQYLSIRRSGWMMPLHTDADKRFVIRVYSEHVRELQLEKRLTSDQLINDFLNYLRTFAWNLRRDKEGYDFLCVDELHLFNEQERLALNFLMRSASEYPRMLMALDPRQAPSAAYTRFQMAEVATAESGEADEALGDVRALDLSQVHRFTPQILELVRHIHRAYPTLDMGHGSDWEVNPDVLSSTAQNGDKPTVVRVQTRTDELAELCRRVKQRRQDATQDRIAVVCIDLLGLSHAASALESAGLQVRTIQSRDDVDSLRFARKSIVVGAAEYLAGLQFEHVFIVGLTDARVANANFGHALRQFLSLLYLAVTRASQTVTIIVTDEAGGLPEVLEQASNAEHVQLVAN